MKKIAVIGKKSLLSRLADKIDPTPEQLAEVRRPKLPPNLLKEELKATLLNRAVNIPSLRDKVITDKGPRVAQPLEKGGVTVHGDRMVFFDDGSLRHAGPVVKGKAARKKFKKLRHRLAGRTHGAAE